MKKINNQPPLEETFSELIENKISFETMMDRIKEEAQEKDLICPECGHPLRISYETYGDSDYNEIAYCDYCGATFSD